jgi:hypothetical protein
MSAPAFFFKIFLQTNHSFFFQCYRFCTSNCGLYLSGYQTVTVWHLRDLINRKRRPVKCNNVRHVIIPQFDGLSIDDLLSFAGKYPEVMEALPLAKKEIKKLPRQYIANIINTIVQGDAFQTWIQERITARNEKLVEEEEMIEMEPEIAAIYQASNEISCKCARG